jgi:hypothetical protein
MVKQTEVDRTLDPGWVAMFTKKGYRRHTALAMGFAFVGQSTGLLVINNYGPTLYATLGYNTYVPSFLTFEFMTVEYGIGNGVMVNG